MNATPHHFTKQSPSLSLATDKKVAIDPEMNTIISALLFSSSITHHPKAGINPAVDAASTLFTAIGKLTLLNLSPHLGTLQADLIKSIKMCQDNIQQLGYHTDFMVVAGYILCATIDDVISSTPWGQSQWQPYSLLQAFNHDPNHEEKLIRIIERAIKEPDIYIDLMELIYLCLSMGYKGHFRDSSESHYQLAQISNSLYKNIRAYRGNFSKTLSPSPKPQSAVKAPVHRSASLSFIGMMTVCVIMIIFISLGYLMDVITNETTDSISTVEDKISQKAETR